MSPDGAVESPYALKMFTKPYTEAKSAYVQAHTTEAAHDPNTGNVLPEGRPNKLHESCSSSQKDRARENGVSYQTQQRLDWLARHAPEQLGRESRDPAVLAEKAAPVGKQGRPTKEEAGKGNGVTFSLRGNAKEYRTAKIARDAPEVWERMKRYTTDPMRLSNSADSPRQRAMAPGRKTGKYFPGKRPCCTARREEHMSSVIRRFAVQQPDKGQSDPEEVGEIPPYLYYGKTHRIPRALLEAANEEAWAALEATVDPKAFIRPVDEMEPVPNGILERYEVFDVDTGDMLIMYRFPFRIKGH